MRLQCMNHNAASQSNWMAITVKKQCKYVVVYLHFLLVTFIAIQTIKYNSKNKHAKSKTNIQTNSLSKILFN